MEYTKGNLAKWLRAELVDLVKDIEDVRKSDMSEFSQGMDIVCAYETKVEKILEKLAAPDLYEALKEIEIVLRQTNLPNVTKTLIRSAIAKAEGK